MIVMFLVSSATASAATSTVLLASATLVDKTGRVRPRRLAVPANTWRRAEEGGGLRERAFSGVA